MILWIMFASPAVPKGFNIDEKLGGFSTNI
jgi:hypothetical protein